MDAILYNKVEEESNRIIRAIQESGGRGGAFDLVQEVIISDNTTHEITIDLPVNWQDTYNYIFMFAELPATYTTQEWLYINFNNASSSTSYYGITSNSVNFFKYTILNRDNTWYLSMATANHGKPIEPTGNDYIKFYLYNASSYFKPDTKFTVYAAKINQ